MRKYGILFCLLLMSSVARAGVRIVPESRGAANLSPKTLALRTEIAGRFARTTATWTFSNAAKAPFEAEFVADAPREAVVTGFAYWFKNEKVVARVVEKLRAAEIYRGITQQRRDPALVEMIARNVFRARISPVAPGDDVKIETTWVQPLLHDNNGWIYEVPLREKGETWSAKWSFEARVLDSPNVGAEANFPLADRAGSGLASTEGALLPDTLRLKLRAVLAKTPVRSSAGGGDYFALRAAPGEKIALPPSATQVWRNATAGGTLIVGRLPRTQNAKNFGDVAEKLWAAAQIDALATNAKNQPKVIALSTRYGLPSKWTSWLAIPEAERQRLKPIIEREKRAQAEANLRVLGLAMAQEIGAGRAKAEAYRKMRAQFDANARIVDAKPADRFASAIDEQLAYYAEQIGYAKYGNRGEVTQQKALARARNLLVRVHRMRAFGSERGRRWSGHAETSIAELQLSYLAPTWVKSRLNGRENLQQRSQIARLLRNAAPDTDDWNNNFAGSILGPFAAQWAKLKAAPKIDAKKVAAARAQVESAASLFPTNATTRRELITSALQSAESSQFYARRDALKTALAAEVVAKRENGEAARKLRAQFAELGARLEFENPDYASATQLPVDKALEKVAADLQRAELEETPDAAKIAQLQTEFGRLKGFAAPYTVEQAQRSGRWATLLKLRREIAQQWVAEAQKDAASQRAAQLKARLQTVLDTQTEKIHEGYAGYHWKAENELRDAERSALDVRARSIRAQLLEEESRLRAQPDKIAALRAQLEAMQATTIYNKTHLTDSLRWQRGEALDAVLKHLRAQRAIKAPDAEVVADLERRVIELQPFDRYAQNWEGWRGARHDSNPAEFGKLRVERIRVRSEREKAQKRLAQAPANVEIKEEVAQWLQQENQLRVRMGDPLIAVKAPQNARQVVALFPDGDLKKLEWNAHSLQWEARFDVPTWAGESDYVVQIVVVFASGARQQLTMHFAVDLRSPQGHAQVKSDGQNWHLKLESDAQTDRVSAFTPWNTRLELKRDADGIFSAPLDVPAAWRGQKLLIRFVVTDKAHNRTEILVDWN